MQLTLQILEKLLFLERKTYYHKPQENEASPETSKAFLTVYVTPNLKLIDQVLDYIDNFGTFYNIPHRSLIVASKTYGELNIAQLMLIKLLPF